MSAAREMPDKAVSDLSEPAGVVLLSAEDDPADTIRPRLDAAGADCSRIVILSAVSEEGRERFPTLLDLAAIRTAITNNQRKTGGDRPAHGLSFGKSRFPPRSRY